MKILVSACLMGTNCKYNGGNNRSEDLLRYLEHLHAGQEELTVIPVCPEQMGGLPTPREPGEIICGIVRTKEGRSIDEYFRRGAEAALRIAEKEKVDLAILQSRSPSCGVNEVYDGTFTGNKIAGRGVFAEMLYHRGISMIDVEDLSHSPVIQGS